MLVIDLSALTAFCALLIKKRRVFLLSLFICLYLPVSQSVLASEASLSVGFIKADRLPYFADKTEKLPVRGLYVDLLDRISHYSGIAFNYQFIPQARIRLYMIKGILDIEPGIDSSWRPNPDEIKNSVYSIPFMRSKEVIAYNKDKFPNFSLSTPNLLNCSVLGFTKSNLAKENKLLTEIQILDMLQKQRCDTAKFPIDVLKYHLNKENLSIGYTQPFVTYSLRLRLHKSKQHLLHKINSSIQSILDSGEFAQLYSKYAPQK